MARKKRGDGDTGQHPEEQMRPGKVVRAAGTLPERGQDILRVDSPVNSSAYRDTVVPLYRPSNGLNVAADVGAVLQCQVSIHRRDIAVYYSGDDAGAAH